MPVGSHTQTHTTTDVAIAIATATAATAWSKGLSAHALPRSRCCLLCLLSVPSVLSLCAWPSANRSFPESVAKRLFGQLAFGMNTMKHCGDSGLASQGVFLTWA